MLQKIEQRQALRPLGGRRQRRIIVGFVGHETDINDELAEQWRRVDVGSVDPGREVEYPGGGTKPLTSANNIASSYVERLERAVGGLQSAAMINGDPGRSGNRAGEDDDPRAGRDEKVSGVGAVLDTSISGCVPVSGQPKRVEHGRVDRWSEHGGRCGSDRRNDRPQVPDDEQGQKNESAHTAPQDSMGLGGVGADGVMSTVASAVGAATRLCRFSFRRRDPGAHPRDPREQGDGARRGRS